ncbi:hypothetical protein Tco_1280951, partial [Tanacetum coccineum]
APPKVLRKDHAAFCPAHSTLGGKSLASIGLEAGSTFFTPTTQETPGDTKSVSDPDPLSYAKPQPHLERRCPVFQENGYRDPHRKCCYHEGARPDFCEESRVREIGLLPVRERVSRRYLSTRVGRDQQLPHGYPGRMPRHGRSHSTARVKLLKKATAKIARQDQRIQAREEEIKKLDQEIKSLRAVEAEFSDLQVSNNQLSQQVSNLQAQVMGEEKIKAAFEELKKYKDDKVEQRCAKMDARLDKLSVDFDEELYPHMLTAIAGLVKGMSEGLKHGIDHGKAGRDLAVVEAYDPEADRKYVKSLQDLRDLKYPLVDQMEGLKDAPMELIMASLYLESDSGEDAP